ncbi:hypothetical protein AD998_07430 [bacterium 336/3]|nr:hypothetical protein AD998_07430 [bacterium 336/3]
MRTLYLVLIVIYSFQTAFAQDLKTPFELSNGLETATYEQGIAFYEKLDAQYEEIKLFKYGNTDVGKPLHLAVFSAEKDFSPESLKLKGKSIFLVINAIHAGEPDGVDASMMLLRDIVQQEKLKKICKNTVFVIIPFYSVGGVLNRNSYSRANQNGPKSYGFRGNGKNYDLNRDFIKMDSENAKTFIEIFHTWKPDIQVDNHVTNGADYQYVMTNILANPALYAPEMADYFKKEFRPDLLNKMKKKNFEMSPYVEMKGTTPDSGLVQNVRSPRFSHTYATQFNTIAMVAETHMLKPFKQRTEATYQLMLSLLEILEKDGVKIQKNRKKSFEYFQKQKSYVVDWKIDDKKFEMIDFKGYMAERIPSKVTGQTRLFYNKTKPYTKKIPYYNVHEPKNTLEKPKMYIIPKMYGNIVKMLEMNGVVVTSLDKKETFNGAYYFIKDYKTGSKPFEGHYLHTDVTVEKRKAEYTLQEGDWVVMTNQPHINFIMNVLEPQAPDSYFCWNHFDIILQQKEYYSDYVFEDIAEKLLSENADLKKRFEEKKRQDPEFAKNAKAQLDFIYYNSPYYEPNHLRYPIFRVE